MKILICGAGWIADNLQGIEQGDRLLILGKADLFMTFLNRLAENRPHFPRIYGQQIDIGH